MTANKPKLIGVAGLDAHSRKHRIPSILARFGRGVEIVAVADADVTPAQLFVRTFNWPDRQLEVARARGYEISGEAAHRFGGVPVYGSLEEMVLEQKRKGRPLDAVVIAGEPALREAAAIWAMEHGCDVLVEATEQADWDKMARVAKARGRVLCPGHSLPYQLEPAREMFAGGEIGDIHALAGARFSVRRDGPNDSDFWADASTGRVADHGASAMLPFFLGSEPRWVRARRYNTFGLDLDADATEIQIRFTDERRAEIKVSRATGAADEKAVLELCGETGTICAPVAIEGSPFRVPDFEAFHVVRRREYADLPTAFGVRPTLSYAGALGEQNVHWTRQFDKEEPRLWLTAEQAADCGRIAHAADSSVEQPGADGWGPWVDCGQPLPALNDLC